MSSLARRLGLSDAVAIGIASMLGAGVFTVWGPAAAVAGSWLLVGLLLAALVAWCNATSSAQLAAQYPEAGGTYVYGRELLGDWPGYLAGFSFIVGKLGSGAAMAMVFASYWAPPEWQRPAAIGVVWLLVLLALFGVKRSASLAKILVVLTLGGILVAVATGWVAPPAEVAWDWGGGNVYGVLQSAGLLFFAFAGYARIATLGEEVKDPAKTIGRAIVGALVTVLVLYAAVGVTLLLQVGWEALADHPASLTLLVEGHPVLTIVLAVAAVAASLGALLGLIAGISRTWLAMSRRGDFPTLFDRTSKRFQTPYLIEISVAVIVSIILLFADLRGVIGFSSFGVLLYYAVANVAAYTQRGPYRRYSKWWQVLGFLLCVVLMFTLPVFSMVVGAIVVGLGIVWRLAKPSD